MDDLLRDLERLGFTHNEAQVYLVVMRLGRATAGEVARSTKIARATTYGVLSELHARGLISVVQEKNDRFYIPEPPARLLSLLHMEQRRLDERRRIADPLMLRLQVFHNSAPNKPKIRYIESVEGLRMMQREYEEIGEDLIQMVGYDAFMALHDPRVSFEHREQLKNRASSVRAILVTEKEVIFPDLANVEVVTISPSVVPVEGEMTVCGDRAALFSYKNGLIAIDVHSKTIADTLRATLELAWREAKRLSEA